MCIFKTVNRGREISYCFATFFVKKGSDIVSTTTVDQNVYNGKRKVCVQCKMFMTSDHINECVKNIKIKNTEGFDRIPQRILVEGREQLLEPLTQLFELIYRDKVIPEQ